MDGLAWVEMLLFGSAFLAGVVNSVAGGGTLLTFPMLLSVVSPVIANGTSTIALLPGSLAGAWGFRQELRPCFRFALWLLIPSLFGGALGTLLVTRFDPRIFAQLVPWLILTASLLFIVQGPIARWLRRYTPSVPAAHDPNANMTVPPWRTLLGVMAFQFLVAVYGGYFGAGIGILMLTALSFMGMSNIHRVNAVKTFLATAINAMSVLVFVIEDKIHWHYAGLMACAAILGGYTGARVSRRLPAPVVRSIIILIGLSLSAYYFWKQSLA